MRRADKNPFSGLNQRELIWLFGILKEACQERLEKNLVNQALEDRLHERHGEIPGRIDPRPTLKEWEPRYRKFLEVATEAHELARSAATALLMEALTEQLAGARHPVRKAR